MKTFSLFSFNVMAVALYLLHIVFIFCIKPGWLLSAISWESCRHCFAMFLSGIFCKWIQNLIIEVSIVNFSGNLPSSFLAATFGHCLFTPKDCLQKYICVFSIMSFSQALKSSLVYMPQISDPYKRMGRKSELMSLLVMSIGSFKKSR